MPDEYFKLPYPAAKSDMLRYGVLYHHGGIYMDADLLAQVSAAINPWQKFVLGASQQTMEVVDDMCSNQNHFLSIAPFSQSQVLNRKTGMRL